MKAFAFNKVAPWRLSLHSTCSQGEQHQEIAEGHKKQWTPNLEPLRYRWRPPRSTKKSMNTVETLNTTDKSKTIKKSMTAIKQKFNENQWKSEISTNTIEIHWEIKENHGTSMQTVGKSMNTMDIHKTFEILREKKKKKKKKQSAFFSADMKQNAHDSPQC